MVSVEEKLGVRKRSFNGLVVYEIAKASKVRAATATLSGDEKLHYVDPVVCVDRTENSWKYGDEVQIVAWSRQVPVVRQRIPVPQLYHRIEICLPVNEAIRLLEQSLKRLWLIC